MKNKIKPHTIYTFIKCEFSNTINKKELLQLTNSTSLEMQKTVHYHKRQLERVGNWKDNWKEFQDSKAITGLPNTKTQEWESCHLHVLKVQNLILSSILAHLSAHYFCSLFEYIELLTF